MEPQISRQQKKTSAHEAESQIANNPLFRPYYDKLNAAFSRVTNILENYSTLFRQDKATMQEAVCFYREAESAMGEIEKLRREQGVKEDAHIKSLRNDLFYLTISLRRELRK
jgi:hypothetical protein